jgi:hypothetical protein
LSQAERAALERRAAGVGLSTYVKSLALGGAMPKGPRRGSADQVLLAQLLGQLGASGLAASMRDLASAADSGSLYVDDLVVRRLNDACDDIRAMHLHLMRALGMKAPRTPVRETMRARFARAATDHEAAR